MEWNSSSKALNNRTSSINHRARKAGDSNKLTVDEVRTAIKDSKGICALCGKEIERDPVIDHRVPMSKGGMNVPENIQVVHRSCNAIKHTKDNTLAKILCAKRDTHRMCGTCKKVKHVSQFTKLHVKGRGDTWNQCRPCATQYRYRYPITKKKSTKNLNDSRNP